MDDYSMFVPDVHFELIPIKSLVSNQDYQRNLSKTHIRRTSENFDLNQINPVKVSRRDGINYVFNGQHTIEIVATVSGSRDTPVWCMIYDELDYTQEADTFANQQKFVKPLVPYEIFMANLEAGNDEQLMKNHWWSHTACRSDTPAHRASSVPCRRSSSYRRSMAFMCWTGLSGSVSALGKAK